MLVWNCSFGSKKKLKFIKNQGKSGSLSKLGIRSSLSNIPLIGDILF